jgi:UDP-GlcNAc:undecaprenyl-phosphate GlcNAc-1-phosphate transferase
MIFFISSACSFLMTMILIPLVIQLSLKYQILDRNPARHGFKVSRLGGVCVFLSYTIAVCILILLRGEYQLLASILPLMMLFFIGLYDDVYNLNPFIKLFFQVLAAYVAVVYTDIVPYNKVFASSNWSYLYCYFLPMLIMICMINAFNLIDGIDGLATMLGILIVFFLGFSLLLYGDPIYAAFAFVFGISLTVFLGFNLSPAKIYLGDCGSMMIGYVAVTLSFRVLKLDWEVSGHLSGDVVYVLALLIVPLFDLFRVFFNRLLRLKSPFSRDQNHIHHRLRLLGWGDTAIGLVLSTYTVLMLLLTYLFSGFTVSWQFFILLLTAILTNSLVTYKLHQEVSGIRINRNI